MMRRVYGSASLHLRCNGSVASTAAVGRWYGSSVASGSARGAANTVDGLVLGMYKGGALTAAAQQLDSSLNGEITKRVGLAASMKGESGQALSLFNLTPELPRVVIVGLGKDTSKNQATDDDDDCEVWEDSIDLARQGAALGVKHLHKLGATSIAVESFGNHFQAVGEGSYLSLFNTNEHKSKKDEDALASASSITITPYNPDSEGTEAWDVGKKIASAQNFSRMLANAPANYMTPTKFVEQTLAKFWELLGSPSSDGEFANGMVKIIVRDQKWAEEQKMGCFLGVSQGSDEPLKFLEIHYNGLEANDDTAPIALVGKGVTFDSGGISIKPAAGMGLMRGDMGGAAAVVGTIYAAAALRLKTKVVVLTPLCENMPSGKAVKPGDVLYAKNGKSVEVDNTDAEGRLILADALVYASTFKPRAIIDVATLTGAISVALGPLAIGAFSSSDKLWADLDKAGRASAERFWRMPLFPAYKTQLKSDYADLRNVGNKGGGSCTAAAFLKEFVTTKAWAHLDIAGVSHSDGSDKHYIPKGMAGKPVRALVEYLRAQHL